MRQPLQTLAMGGGVWRIRQLHRTQFGQKFDRFGQLLAVAAMHNGFHIVDSDKCEIVASYTEEHQSLAYGIDIKSFPENESEEKEDCDCLWISSCSFYDHLQKLWSVSL